jgi:hypothetical protein
VGRKKKRKEPDPELPKPKTRKVVRHGDSVSVSETFEPGSGIVCSFTMIGPIFGVLPGGPETPEEREQVLRDLERELIGLKAVPDVDPP